MPHMQSALITCHCRCCCCCCCCRHFDRQQASTGPSVPPAVLQRLALLEGKLTWLVYICGALVGGYSWSDASSQDGEEAIDAR
jgi:hypothetical protein